MKTYLTIVLLTFYCFSYGTALNGTVSAEVTCINTNNGQVTLIDLTIDGGFSPYDFQWSNGSTSEDIEVAFEGNYSVTVTDALCGEAILDIPVTGICCQDCYPIDANVGPGSIFVDIECQETSGFTYQWSDGETGNPRTDLAIGTYCVTATSNNGCVQIGCWDVTTECETAPVTDSNVDVTHSCTAAPMSGALEVINPSQNLNYWWTGPSNYFMDGPTINNLFPGEYCLTITEGLLGNPCPVAAGCFTIEPDGDQCCDDCYPIQATVDLGQIFVDLECLETGGFIYEWSDGGTGNPRKKLELGIYCVTVTSLTSDCSLSGCWEITEECPPILQLGVQDADVSCSSGDNGYIEIRSSEYDANAYPIWTDSDGYYVGSGFVLENMPPGEYCVEILDGILGGSCVLAEGCYTIDETDLRVDIANLENNYYCNSGLPCDGNIGLAVSTSSSNLSYNWTGPDGFTAATQNISGLCIGNYSVVVTESGGCSVTINTSICCCEQHPLSDDPLPSCYPYDGEGSDIEVTLVEIQQVDQDLGIELGAINLSVNGGINGYYYSWTGPSGFTSNTIDINDLELGQYCFTVGDGCEELTECFEIVDCGAIVWAINGDVTPSCPGANAGIVEITSVTGGTPPFSYDWGNGFSEDNNIVEGLAEGDHLVTVMDANYCQETQMFYVGEEEPNITIAPNIDDTCPEYDYGTIILNADGDDPGFTYNWSQGGNGAVAYYLAMGNYFVTVRDSRGCTAEFGPLPVGDSNQVVPEDVIDDCTHLFYCNGNELDDLTMYDFDISDYDPDDCRYLDYLCEDSNGDIYSYFPDGNTTGYEFYELQEEDIEYTANLTECFAQYYCQNGDPYGDIIQGYFDPIEFHDYEDVEGCYYCFTAIYCVLEMGDPIGEIKEVVDIIPHIYITANDPYVSCGSGDSCLVKIGCTLLPEGDDLLAENICDPDCTNNNTGTTIDTDLLCSMEVMEDIANSFIGNGNDRIDESELMGNLVKGLLAKVYPNPFTDDFYIEIESKLVQNEDYIIYNILGQQIDKSAISVLNGKNIIKIEGSMFQETGVYYLVLKGEGDIAPVTIPIVKQN